MTTSPEDTDASTPLSHFPEVSDVERRLASKYDLYAPKIFYRERAIEKGFAEAMLRKMEWLERGEPDVGATELDKQILYLFRPECRPMEKTGKEARTTKIRNPPRIRKPLELLIRQIDCPYKYARSAVSLAIRQANDDTEHYYHEIEFPNEKLRRPLDAIAAARSALEDFLFLHSPWIISELKSQKKITDRETEAHYLDRVWDAVELFNSIGNDLKDVTFDRREGKPLDVWHKSYVERMGYAWYRLTGRDPSNSRPFIDFLTSGLKTVYQVYDKKPPEFSINWRNDIGFVSSKVARERGWDYFEPETWLRREHPGHDNFKLVGWQRRRGYLFLSEKDLNANKICLALAKTFAEETDTEIKQSIESEARFRFGNDINLHKVLADGYLIEPYSYNSTYFLGGIEYHKPKNRTDGPDEA